MAKIICITTGLTGITNASFELIKRLSLSGHEVIAASPNDIREKVTKQGIKYEQLVPLTFNPSPALPTFQGKFKRGRRLFYMLRNISKRKKLAVEAIYPHSFVKLINRHQPDLLILDLELHEYIVKAYAMEVPFILFNQFFSIWKRRGLPSIRSKTIPGVGLTGTTIAIKLSWLFTKIKRRWKFQKIKILTGFTNRRTALHQLIHQECFPNKYIGGDFWPGFIIYNQLTVISTTAEELEFPHIKRENLFYVGPMVNIDRKEQKAITTNDYTIEEVFSTAKNTNKKLIYCSVSTLQKGDTALLEKIINAVSAEKDWILIITLGGLIKNWERKMLPSNVFTFSYLPQLKVLSKADCSINHGGIHTINECIHFKVPMLIYSGKKSDQNGNAARIHFHEIGLRGDKDKVEVSEIKKNLREVLSNPLYKKNLVNLQEKYLDYKRKEVLENTIDNFLSKHKKANDNSY